MRSPITAPRTRLVAVAGALAAVVPLAAVAVTGAPAQADGPAHARHVLVISIDGMHQYDLDQWTAQHPDSTLAQLAGTGTTYTDASTTHPSDSFPGTLAEFTGGTPKTTGVFYDVTYDRSLYPPRAQGGPSSCTGPAGTATKYEESIDTNAPSLANGEVGTRTILGETIDPSQLPQAAGPGGTCVPVYPSDFLNTNTVFSVAHRAGLYTAWADKHPSYEALDGHGSRGAIDDLFNTEINADIIPSSLVDTRGTTVTFPDTSVGITGTMGNVEAYDQIKVDAILNEIDGKTSAGAPAPTVPNIFGMNFQTVSVGEKLVDPTQAGNPSYVPGGYEPGSLVFTPQLEGGLAFVDHALGEMVSELQARGLLSSTEIIVTAKHGQSPINPATLSKIGHAEVQVLTNAGIQTAAVTDDDVALIWLKDQSQTAAAVAALKQSMATTNSAHIQHIYAGQELDRLFGDPAENPRTPDIIIQPTPGTIYTTSSAKVAEHGGFSADDTHVPLLVVQASDWGRAQEAGSVVGTPVATTQIAPTILATLGLNPMALDAVRAEGTQILPGLEPARSWGIHR
jgi:hypothetical protein